MYIFTSDIDWCTEEVLEDMLSLFEKFNVKCTLFATHDSNVLRECSRELFEIAIHPNFNPLLNGSGGNFNDVINNLLSIYPEAKGVRSHSLVQSSGILSSFADKGFVYDANLFLPYHKEIKPFKLWNGIVRIPYNWEDDVHWLYDYSFSDSHLDPSNALNILDFHPIHVFLNTENEEHYQRAKPFYHEYQGLKKFQNLEVYGARTLLLNTLQKVAESKQRSYFLREIAEDFNRETVPLYAKIKEE